MKTTYLILITAFSCLIFAPSWAQNQGANMATQQIEKEPPEGTESCGSVLSQEGMDYLNSIDKEACQQLLKRYMGSPGRNHRDYTVQFHIMQMDDGSGGIPVQEIRDEFENFVNPYYDDIGASFVECAPPLYHATTEYYILADQDEGDDMSELYNVADVINIYFVGSVAGCGYARFPWRMPSDYIVITNGCHDNNSTIAHELGHYFGLLHTHETWEDTKIENVTRDDTDDCWNCETAGDELCDTEADPNLSGNVASGCLYDGSPATGPCDETYVPDPENIMSYSLKTCRTIFSPGQYARMETYMDGVNRAHLQSGCPCERPEAICQDITVNLDANGNASITPEDVDNESTWDCGFGSWSVSPNSFDCSDIGANTVTLTVTDALGWVSTCEATVTIADVTPPDLTCPDNIHLPECEPIATWSVVASDECGNVTVVSEPPSGSEFPKGVTTTVTVTATDGSGNVSTCSFEVERDPDLEVSIDAVPTSDLNTCAVDANAHIVLGYGGGPTCVTLNSVGSGGHSPYTYSWEAPAAVPAGSFTSANTANPTFCADFQTEHCVTYTFRVTVTDVHGCEETNEVDVNVVNLSVFGDGSPCASPENPKVVLCHIPPQHPENQQTICISPNAVPAHYNGNPQAHDNDCLGDCDAVCISETPEGLAAKHMGDAAPVGSEQKSTLYEMAVTPNPFTSTTTIQILARTDTEVQLAVFDVSGRMVAKLYEGSLQRGVPNYVEFNSGALQAGIYIAKLIGINGDTQSSTMVLVK